MVKKIVTFGFVAHITLVALISLLSYQEIVTLQSKYSTVQLLRWVLAEFEVSLDFTYVSPLNIYHFLTLGLPLFLTGFLTGLLYRDPFHAFLSSLVAGLLVGVFYDLGLWLISQPLANFTSLSQAPFFVLNVVNGFIIGVLIGIFASIGGKLTQKTPTPPPPTVKTEQVRSICSQCGSIYDSTPLFCANCGEKLRQEYPRHVSKE